LKVRQIPSYRLGTADHNSRVGISLLLGLSIFALYVYEYVRMISVKCWEVIIPYRKAVGESFFDVV
jgi:hypothetical protein